MRRLIADSFDELYVKALETIRTDGQMTHPRGFDCQELSPCSLTLSNIQKNILVNSVRKASHRFMAAEFLWILMGRNDVDWISEYSKKIIEFSDDGKIFFGAYGPKIYAQLGYVISSLNVDPWTRQAVITIWRECPKPSRDIPCTIMFHFLRRPLDTLNLIVYMRSQDAWLGLPYDVHNFTSLQLLLAGYLSIKPGKFTLIQGSLHLYEQHFKQVDQMNYDPALEEETTPLGSPQAIADLLTMVEHPFDLKLMEISDPLLSQKIGWL